MPNVNLSWSPPATRASGKPLDPADIAGYTIEISADAGQNYQKLTDNAKDQLTRTFTELEPGEWRWRVACFDTKNRTGAKAETSLVIADDTPPGAVLNLTATLA